MMEKLPNGCIVGPQGKTKAIFLFPEKEKYHGIVWNWPRVTAGDGKHHEYLSEKGALVTTTTCNIFALLNKSGIPTHFCRKIGDNAYLVKLLTMMPIEIVVRRYAYGSYCKRNHHVSKGVRFEYPLSELFYKGDTSDPYMCWNQAAWNFTLHKPDMPLNDNHESPDDERSSELGVLYPASDPRLPHNEKEINEIYTIATAAFLVLERAFSDNGVILIDFKIECGRDQNGIMRIGDQIDGDSFRLHEKDGTPIDKDLYRNIAKEGRAPTNEEREMIIAAYRRVADITKRF